MRLKLAEKAENTVGKPFACVRVTHWSVVRDGAIGPERNRTGGRDVRRHGPIARAGCTRARPSAYNAGKFDEAIAAATDAMHAASQANAAAVVLGRSHLERFRMTNTGSDLEAARAALRQVVPDKLAPRDRVEFLVGLGESLYLEGCTGCFGAAAEMFQIALARSDAGADRDAVFEWWASALDRQAQFGKETDPTAVYKRLLDGANQELAVNDRSASATYWLMAAAHGTGDLERAWGAAIAGWVRARTLGAKGDALRTDLDRFVTQVLLPERARQEAPDDARPSLARLVAQWEEIKSKYSWPTLPLT